MSVPGVRSAPVGFYDEPPPEEVPGLRGVNVGNSGVVRFGRDLTGLLNEFDQVLDDLLDFP